MDDHHLLLPAEVDDALHEVEVDARAGRVVGEGDDEDAGLRPADLPRRLEALEEVGVGAHGHLAQVGAGEERAVDVDRVAGAGHDGGVARLQQHPHEVAEALLRADGVGDLGLGVERDAPLALVERGDRLSQLGQPLAHGVAVVAGDAGRLGQLLHRDLGRRDVGVAEAEVDHVHASSPSLGLQVVDDREDVRRQVRDPAELHPVEATAGVQNGSHESDAQRGLHLRRRRDPER